MQYEIIDGTMPHFVFLNKIKGRVRFRLDTLILTEIITITNALRLLVLYRLRTLCVMP